MNAFSVLQDDGDSSSSSDEEPTPVPVKSGSESKTAGESSGTKGDKSADGAEGDGKKAEKEAVVEEEKSISFDEYEAQKAAQKAAVAAGLGKKKVKARKVNDGGDAFAKMQAHKKADVAATDGEADASSLLSSVQIKEVPAAKGLKDSTHQAVQDAHKIQSFFNEQPRGGGRGGRGGYRGGGGGDRGGRGGSWDARRSNYSGHGAPQRDFRDQRQFNRDGNDNHEGGRGGRGGANGFRGGRGGRGDRGGYQRREHYQSGPRSHPPATVGAPNMDDQAAFPSLG